MRPKTANQDKLQHGVRVRMTNMEKRILQKRCKEEGYRTMSDFCRAKLVKRREIRKIEVSRDFALMVKQLDYDLNKIGVNLNQLSKAVNSNTIYQFTPSDRTLFKRLLNELRNCFLALENYMDIIE